MSDVFILLTVLAVFYAYDCSLWLPRNAVVFLTFGLRGWRPVQPHPLLSGGAKGLVVSFRLPPLTPVFLCEARPQVPCVGSSLDLAALRNDLACLAVCGALLRVLCNALFVYLFIVLPLAMLVWSVTVLWPTLLTALVVLVVPIAVEFRDLHAWLWPTDTSDRRSELAHIGLYPPAALRALDRIAHRLCRPYHPLAVAAVLSKPPVFAKFAARELRRLYHPLATDTAQPDLPSHEILAIRRALEAEGVRPDDLLAPPPHVDASSVSYCPRCESAYTLATGTCVDCPGVSLVQWREAPPPVGKPSILRALP